MNHTHTISSQSSRRRVTEILMNGHGGEVNEPLEAKWLTNTSCTSSLPIVSMVGKKSPDLSTHVMIWWSFYSLLAGALIVSIQSAWRFCCTFNTLQAHYIDVFWHDWCFWVMYMLLTMGIHTTITQNKKLCERYDISLLLQWWLFIRVPVSHTLEP